MKRRLQLLGFFLVCAVAAAVALCVMFVEALRGREKAVDLAVGFDQTMNVVLNGSPDETISSRAYRGSGRTWYWRIVRWVLDSMQPGHCLAAYEAEVKHKHYPIEYQQKG